MLAPNPIAQFAAWWELAEREVPLCRRDDARHGRRRGRTGRADGAAQGLRRGRVPVLHQPRVREGGADRWRRAGGPGHLLARGRPPGPGPRHGRAPERRRVRCLFRDPPAGLAARRLGLASEPTLARPRRAGRTPERGHEALRRDGEVPRARPTGAAISSATRRSSSGRARWRGCTTASATRGRATAGGSSGWGPDGGRRRVLETALYYPHHARDDVLRFYDEVLGMRRVAGWDDGTAYRLGAASYCSSTATSSPSATGPWPTTARRDTGTSAWWRSPARTRRCVSDWPAVAPRSPTTTSGPRAALLLLQGPGREPARGRGLGPLA